MTKKKGTVTNVFLFTNNDEFLPYILLLTQAPIFVWFDGEGYTRLRCRSERSGLVQSCYERAIRLTIHLLGASNDDFGAYDGVNFSPKSVTPWFDGTSIVHYYFFKEKSERT